MVDVTDSKSVGGDTVWVRVPPPAPRQNKAMRSCGGTSTATSTDDLVFPFQPRPADAGLASDRETGSDLDCPGAPAKGKSEQDFPFFGAAPSARMDPLRPNAKEDSRPLSRSSHADLKVGSDLNCPGAPRRSSLRMAQKWQSQLRLPFSHLCSVAPSSQIEPASLGFDSEPGSDLGSRC